VFQGDSPRHWQKFDEYAADIRSKKIPVFPILGNHEYYGSKDRAQTNYFSRFPHLEKRRWYSLRFHSAGIILLDSNFDRLEENEQEDQHNWYLQVLEDLQADSSIEYIVVACHHAPYTNSRVVNDDKEVQRDFVVAFKSTPKAKLFFSGHCHSYEHFVMDDKHFIVSGGGGGPRHPLRIDPGKRRHKDQC
jgi:3',5'-cyclic AMP phosphodiesterase CpdA